ncbi:hypothetical protein EJB05_00100, partial [Eragrostis curvula]
MEVVNNMVSETLILEGAALEELKAFLDLQVKLVFEALDERIAARNTKRDALCAQSSARTSGGSGVFDAAVAQEVTLDLNLAAAATSTTHAERSDIDVGAHSSCSTKFPTRVNDVSVAVPACIIATEVIPELNHVANATSAIYAKPGDIDIAAFTKCSTKCSSHTEFTASTAVYASAEEYFNDPVLATATCSNSTRSCIGTPFTASSSGANTATMDGNFKLLLEEMQKMEMRLCRKMDERCQSLEHRVDHHDLHAAVPSANSF